eukprot:jgi/Tetstr1/422508/TSEL_001270.t1
MAPQPQLQQHSPSTRLLLRICRRLAQTRQWPHVRARWRAPSVRSSAVPREAAGAKPGEAATDTFDCRSGASFAATARRASVALLGVAASLSVNGACCLALEYPYPFPPDAEDAVPLASSRVFKTRGNAQLPSARAPPAREIPRLLNADGTEESLEYLTTEPAQSSADSAPPPRPFDAARWRRAAFQWAVILAVVYKVQTDRGRGNAVTRKLGLQGAAGKALVGKRYRLTLDIGREPGTWMPPDWGASGRRILAPLAIEFKAGGLLEVIGVGAFVPMRLEGGSWSLDGDTLRFNVSVSGMSKGDISLPEGKLYFKTLAWGSSISSSKGKLLLLARRFVIRREWRSAGVFSAEPIGEAGDIEGGGLNTPTQLTLPPMRVRERRTG